MKRITLLAMVLSLTLLLCAGVQAAAIEPTDVLGDWYAHSFVTEGATLSPAAMGFDTTMRLAEDYTATLEMTGEDTVSETWSIADGMLIVTVTEDESVMAFTLEDGNLRSVEMEGMVMVFSRNKPEAGVDYEVYIHPDAGYGFAVPEGWMVVDRVNAEDFLAQVAQNIKFGEGIRSTLEQMQGLPYAILYEINKIYPENEESAVFLSSMNVSIQDLGAEADISEILPYADAFEDALREMFGEYEPIVPMLAIELGPWEAAVMGGQFQLGGNDMQCWSLRVISGTNLYEITLTALAEEAEAILELMGYMVASFFAP